MRPVESAQARRALLRHDLLVTAGIAAVELTLLLVNPASVRTAAQFPLAVGWLALLYLVLPLRRLRPWLAVGATAVHTTVATLFQPELATSTFGVMLVTYTIASRKQLGPAVAATHAMWLPPTLVM